MKIKYITEDDLNTIRINLQTILKKVIKHNEITISELFENSAFIKDSSMEIESFQLDMSQPKGKESLTDIENIQRVYNHMRFLSDSQASDERIWAAYTLSEFKDYMVYRWPAEKVDDLKNRYLFGYSVQRSLFRNGIARLWWIGRVTYDDKRSDPYELTKFVCQEQDFIESICGRNVFNNPRIGNAVITALFNESAAGMEISRNIVREIGKYINLLAGTYIIDVMDTDELAEKVHKKLEILKCQQ